MNNYNMNEVLNNSVIRDFRITADNGKNGGKKNE